MCPALSHCVTVTVNWLLKDKIALRKGVRRHKRKEGLLAKRESGSCKMLPVSSDPKESTASDESFCVRSPLAVHEEAHLA